MQVWPKNDEIRKILKHPTKVGFRETGPSDWPNDSFTYRRIQDGDVVLKDPTPVEMKSEPKHLEAKPKPDIGKV